MKGPVLAFDVNATRGAKLTRIEPVQIPAEEVAAPDVAPASRYTEKAIARAELASLYAGLWGVELQKTDLLERLTADNGADLSSEAIAKALSDVGLVAKVAKPKGLTAKMWPALAEMTSGQVILVMSQ